MNRMLEMACRAGLAAMMFATMLAAGIAEESPKSVSADAAVAVAKDFTSTHKQARIIKPMHDGQAIVLNTYCLDKEGNILACVGGDTVRYVANEDGTQQSKTMESPKLLQTYSPEGELLRTTELTFRPTAVNQAPDGSIYVAGVGKVAHVSADGKVLNTVDSPHIGDMDSFKQRIEEGAKKQNEEMTATYREQVVRIEERIEALKKTPEADITDRDKKRLETYEQQKTMYQNQLKAMEVSTSRAFSGEQMLSRKMGITALAVTSRDLFVCCTAIEGYGYEVWRMTHEFSEPVKVVSQLGGCCGQCDIQATDEHLVLAENTKFQVGLLDREGTRLTGFGKGDRKAVDGFGSCCNPMNVRCCDNGDILTAESSIGTIKRFSKDGELLGVVGKAKIGGGCKHVALGYDSKRNRYYMMNIDKSHICVLVPNAEAPEITPDEALAKAAREGLGQKLIGEWSLDGRRPAPETAAAATKTETGAETISVTTVPTEAAVEAALDVATDAKVIAVTPPTAAAAIATTPASAATPATAQATIATTGPTRLRISRVVSQAVSGVAQSKSPASPVVSFRVPLQSDPYATSYFQFHADGKLTMLGGLFAARENAWESLRQDGNTLIVAQIQDSVQYYNYKIEFVSDDEALISMMSDERVMSSNRYKRVKEESVDRTAAEAAGAVDSVTTKPAVEPATGVQE